ncbi:MAG: hypothetical protein U5L11_02605 [Arhodomonas sp.]|nr:hypothetical protein [Arhodomonas sp.]
MSTALDSLVRQGHAQRADGGRYAAAGVEITAMPADTAAPETPPPPRPKAAAPVIPPPPPRPKTRQAPRTKATPPKRTRSTAARANPGAIADAICATLAEHGPMGTAELARATKLTAKQVHNNLHNLKRRGRVFGNRGGPYGLTPQEDSHAPNSHWRGAEDAILSRGGTLHDILQALAEHGSRRTARAVVARMKRLDLHVPFEPITSPKTQEPTMPPTTPAATTPTEELQALSNRLSRAGPTIDDIPAKRQTLEQLADLMRADAPSLAEQLDAIRTDLRRLGEAAQ